MINLISEPLTNRALSLTDVLQFTLDANGASVDANPVFATVLISIDGTTGGGAADGQNITLFDTIFLTDSTEPFTANTWDASGTPEEAATNLGNMLRANFLFREFDITVTYVSAGNVWRVLATATETKTFENFIFSGAGFVPAFVDLIAINGAPAQLNNFRIYYDIFEGVDTATINKLGNTRVAYVPYNSVSGEQNAVIDLRPQLSNIFELHSFLANTTDLVKEEPGLKRRFYLKYGGLNFDSSCNASYVAGGQSSRFELIYTALQRDRFTNFQEFTIIGRPIGSVRWLTDREAVRDIPADYYETVNVYIPEDENWQTWNARFSFYDDSDTLIGLTTRALDKNKVYQVATGSANLAGVMPVGTAYYTIEIIAVELVGGLPTPPQRVFELLRRNLVNANCSKYEMYFIEDLNSYRTIRLQKLQSYGITGASRRTSQPIFSEPAAGFYTGEDYLNRGGLGSHYTEANEVLTFQTERIEKSQKSLYAQLLRSPIHLLKETTADGREVIRKIVLTRSNNIILQNGAAIKLSLEFRYNENLNLLK
jgi:hypothetical protein